MHGKVTDLMKEREFVFLIGKGKRPGIQQARVLNNEITKSS